MVPIYFATLLILASSGFPGRDQGQPEVLPPPRSLLISRNCTAFPPARIPRHSSLLLSLVLIALLWVGKGTVVLWSPNTVRPVLLTLMPPPGARQLGPLASLHTDCLNLVYVLTSRSLERYFQALVYGFLYRRHCSCIVFSPGALLYG